MSAGAPTMPPRAPRTAPAASSSSWVPVSTTRPASSTHDPVGGRRLGQPVRDDERGAAGHGRARPSPERGHRRCRPRRWPRRGSPPAGRRAPAGPARAAGPGSTVSRCPPSPTTVSSPSGSASTQSSAPTRPSAARRSSSVGVRAGQPQVVGQRPGEHVHLLGDQRDRPPDPAGPRSSRLDAAEPDRAAGRPVDAGDQLGQRGLAGAAGADQRDPLARGRRRGRRSCSTAWPGQVGVAEPGRARPTRRPAPARPRPGLRRGRQVGHADQPGQAGRRGLRVVDQAERDVDRAEQAVEVQRGGGRRADGHRSRCGPARSR